MSRYVKDMQLHLDEKVVKSEMEVFFREMGFYPTTWKDEKCFCADCRIENAFHVSQNLRRMYFFTYIYRGGLLHYEAWVRDGNTGERSLVGFAAADLTQPYMNRIVQLENRLIDKLPEDSICRTAAREEQQTGLNKAKKFEVIRIIVLILAVSLLFMCNLIASGR